MVSSSCCSYRGPGFKPPNQHGSSYVSVIPVQGDPIASLGTKHACSVHTYKYGGKTLLYTLEKHLFGTSPWSHPYCHYSCFLGQHSFQSSSQFLDSIFSFPFPMLPVIPLFPPDCWCTDPWGRRQQKQGTGFRRLWVQHRLWKMTSVSLTNIMPGNI